MRLFVYGQLCRRAVVYDLLGRVPLCEPAVLLDHDRRRNPDTGYYEALPVEGRQIPGWMYRGLKADEMRRLDEYEGVPMGLYRRARARARTLSGLPAETRVDVYVSPTVTEPQR